MVMNRMMTKNPTNITANDSPKGRVHVYTFISQKKFYFTEDFSYIRL